MSNNCLVAIESRLGLLYPPLGRTDVNHGVERAPSTLLKKLRRAADLQLTWAKPEEVGVTQYSTVIAHELSHSIENISQVWKSGQNLVTFGGDHAVSAASFGAVINRCGTADVGLLIIDSHSDLHLWNSSPSGNFHGMWVRPLVDQFDQQEINNVFPDKIVPAQLAYIGRLDQETEEIRFMKQHQVKHANPQLELILEDWQIWLNRFTHIHVSFDIDVFDQSLVRATGMPSSNGCTWQQLAPILELCSNHASWSLDVVEINPLLSGSAATLTVAQKVLQQFGIYPNLADEASYPTTQA